MTEVEKLAKYLLNNLKAEEGRERGEVDIYWKGEETLRWGYEVYEKMATDIIKYLKCQKLKQ